MEDVEEIWDLIDRAPAGVPFCEGDREGYHLDLLVRAGKKMAAIDEIKKATCFLLVEHPFAGMIRPVVMLITRAVHEQVSKRVASANV